MCKEYAGRDETVPDAQLLPEWHPEKAQQVAEIAKETILRQANKSEAQKCIVLGDESLKNGFTEKAEKMYRKAAQLDNGINLGLVIHQYDIASSKLLSLQNINVFISYTNK